MGTLVGAFSVKIIFMNSMIGGDATAVSIFYFIFCLVSSVLFFIVVTFKNQVFKISF